MPEELINPAVKGTLNVLRSCAKVPSIKRVIATSSMAAVAFIGKPLAPDVIVDETWFSGPSFCEKSKLWYALSKTLAEEAAWKFAEENGIDMVAINPGLVIGPFLQPTLCSSVEPILNLAKGIQVSHAIYNRWVDVRDVANAHIEAFGNPSAFGRYCLVAHVLNCSEVLKILCELYPSLSLSEKLEDDRQYEPKYQVSMEKAKGLGTIFISWEITLRDTIESLKEMHFLSF
ncbi:hypothetical protein Patl1_17138 [Pistacia atlantica]|uniref:Uncharacterized protein n=1 Tax=Pistacia atlantica TaxID=434234 RepID=A0ACC1B5C8_9ROSI|nr:hypothetical protein Patl1_17138 [Pistacia atlantica]